jgi:hypothetical protein
MMKAMMALVLSVVFAFVIAIGSVGCCEQCEEGCSAVCDNGVICSAGFVCIDGSCCQSQGYNWLCYVLQEDGSCCRTLGQYSQCGLIYYRETGLCTDPCDVPGTNCCQTPAGTNMLPGEAMSCTYCFGEECEHGLRTCQPDGTWSDCIWTPATD